MEGIAQGQMVYCRGCGKPLHMTAVICPNCGAPQRPAGSSDKLILPAFLLCFFVGFLGVHRFYVGKIGTGILQIFTFGGLGIWVLIDMILILVGSFTDKQGRKLTQWT
jgi:TM2 domain-containing membrane protein YozV